MPHPEGKCLIISGGEYPGLPAATDVFSYIIACDRGWLYAKKAGLIPDLVIGDFDSSPVPKDRASVEIYPERKDDTDTMLAAKHALKLGYSDITICCAFGGRMDHTLANIQAAAFIVSSGGEAELIGKDTLAFAFTGTKKAFPKKGEYSFSIFSLSDQCTGVSIRGSQYDCENIVLTNSFPLGVSNAWSEDVIEVAAGSGILLVVESRL